MSGTTTPHLLEADARGKSKSKMGAGHPSPQPGVKKTAATYTEDIEPEDLLPLYMESKSTLFAIQRARHDAARSRGRASNGLPGADAEEALLLAKIDRVEKDILFDKMAADQQWRAKRLVLEQEYAATKKKAAEEEAERAKAAGEPSGSAGSSSDSADVMEEAERMTTDLLEEMNSDDEGLADLFASLPTHEVDPLTGQTSTVMKGSDGQRITIRDFAKWSGVSPVRILEEACRAR